MKTKTTMPPTINNVNEQGKNEKNGIINTSIDDQKSNETDKVETQKRPIEIARDLLKSHSHEVKDLVEAGMFETINDAIIGTVYKDATNQDFKSYKEWKKEGFQVRKGEKAFLLWGRPKEHQLEGDKLETDKAKKETKNEIHDSYFPVAYVFSNAQLEAREISIEHEENETIDQLKNIRSNGLDRVNDMER
jgi:hypothetical protein